MTDRTLREKCIEAGAEAYERAWRRWARENDPFRENRPAEATKECNQAYFDAILGVLRENADEWASRNLDVWADMDNLLTVLEEPS